MFGNRASFPLFFTRAADPAGAGAGRSPLQLEPKAASVLAVLREAAGETVSRRSLLDRCWAPEQGSDEALTQAVSQLRRVLNDSPARPRFVATVPGIGYRWVGSDSAALGAAVQSRSRFSVLAARIAIGLTLIALGGAVAMTSRQIWPAQKLQITTEVRLGKDGQKQVVSKTVQR